MVEGNKKKEMEKKRVKKKKKKAKRQRKKEEEIKEKEFNEREPITNPIIQTACLPAYMPAFSCKSMIV